VALRNHQLAYEKPTQNETLWVLRAQVGDREAFGQIFLWSERLLRAHIMSILRDPAAVEDVLQEVFLTIYRRIKWLRDPNLFRPWVFRVGTREALRFRRRHFDRREDPLDLEVGSVSGESRLVAGLLSKEVLLRLEAVSAESRAILSLHYLEDMSISEAADILGVPVGTAKSRLARGIRKLKALLTKEGR